jgi:hypothetical protein
MSAGILPARAASTVFTPVAIFSPQSTNCAERATPYISWKNIFVKEKNLSAPADAKAGILFL